MYGHPTRHRENFSVLVERCGDGGIHVGRIEADTAGDYLNCADLYEDAPTKPGLYWAIGECGADDYPGDYLNPPEYDTWAIVDRYVEADEDEL